MCETEINASALPSMPFSTKIGANSERRTATNQFTTCSVLQLSGAPCEATSSCTASERAEAVVVVVVVAGVAVVEIEEAAELDGETDAPPNESDGDGC